MSNVNGTTNFPIGLDPPFADWRGLIFEEDEAMRIALSGIIAGSNNGTKLTVPFYWGLPQRQMNPQDQGGNQGNSRGVPQIRYPNISCSFLDMRRDAGREQRNFNQVTVFEPNSGDPLNGTATIDMPIPLSLFYQITVTSMNMQHTRQIANLLTYQFLLVRFGVLMCPSGTVRRLDIVSGPKPAEQLNSEKKRVFRLIWVVSVSSEIEYGSDSPSTPVQEALLSVSNGGVTADSPVLEVETITVTAP